MIPHSTFSVTYCKTLTILYTLIRVICFVTWVTFDNILNPICTIFTERNSLIQVNVRKEV